MATEENEKGFYDPQTGKFLHEPPTLVSITSDGTYHYVDANNRSVVITVNGDATTKNIIEHKQKI